MAPCPPPNQDFGPQKPNLTTFPALSPFTGTYSDSNFGVEGPQLLAECHVFYCGT